MKVKPSHEKSFVSVKEVVKVEEHKDDQDFIFG